MATSMDLVPRSVDSRLRGNDGEVGLSYCSRYPRS